MNRLSLFSVGFLTLFFVVAQNHAAFAQLNNKPFSFNTPGGGVGMSTGGRQAILNQEILDMTPKNLVRDANGNLLSVVEGKGDTAIVRYEGGSFIPNFRGTSFRGDNASWAVGVFNAFFEPRNNGSLSSAYSQPPTGTVISTWTGRVASDSPISYAPATSVDIWTGMVQIVGY